MEEREEVIKIKGKICLLGDCSVGKTSLIRRFVFDSFEEKYMPTFGTNITKKSFTIPYPEYERKVDLTLLIWDIMGNPGNKFESYIDQYQHFVPHNRYFLNAKGAIIVCDLTRKNTFENLKKWVQYLFGFCGEVPLVVVGNKIDLIDKKEIEVSNLIKFAKDNKGESTLTSAKTGDNVEKMFYTIGDMIIGNVIDWAEEI
jgi:small GTP-binding protein